MPQISESSTPLPIPPSAPVESLAKENKMTSVMQWSFQSLRATFAQAGLIVIKAMLIPVIIATAVTASIFLTISYLWTRVFSRSLPEKEAVSLSHHLTSILNDIQEWGRIFIDYGKSMPGEQLQLASNQPNSPTFLLIEPENRRQEALPILYAPGYLDEAETMRSSARRIANQTGCPVYLVNYRSRFQSIEEHSQDVGQVIARMCQDRGKEHFIAMGHSMGGLTTGHYIAQHAKEKVRLWITIGSPLQGSPLAKLAALFRMGVCARDMVPHSPFLRRFKQSLAEELKEVPALHIQSKTDFVVPYESATRETCHERIQNHVSSRVVGHLGVRCCPHIEEKIAQEIEKLIR